MDIDFSKFTASDYAAWWGAIIASLALVWNIVVAIRSGARIKVTVSPNMQVHPKQPITEDNKYILVIAVNHGSTPTTITHFSGYYAPGFWSLIRGGKKVEFVVIPNQGYSPIPFVLGPGAEWSNLADQKNIIEKSKGGNLYLGVCHSQNKRPVYKRVKIIA